MHLTIQNFDIKNSLKNFCKTNGGKNLKPDIFLKTYHNCKHYALILEDTSPACGKNTVVHWYIPYIHAENEKIINFIQGYNTTSEGGKKYVGPCAPSNPTHHNYKFIVYALDKKFVPSKKELHIISSKDYENFLKVNNIKILKKDVKNFKLFIDNNFYKQFNVFVDRC